MPKYLFIFVIIVLNLVLSSEKSFAQDVLARCDGEKDATMGLVIYGNANKVIDIKKLEIVFSDSKLSTPPLVSSNYKEYVGTDFNGLMLGASLDLATETMGAAHFSGVLEDMLVNYFNNKALAHEMWILQRSKIKTAYLEQKSLNEFSSQVDVMRHGAEFTLQFFLCKVSDSLKDYFMSRH